MLPSVAIIILNWNGWQDTIECLESLFQITYPNYHVVLVDNFSNDESITKIKGYAYGKLTVQSKFFKQSTNNKPIEIFEYYRYEVEECKGWDKNMTELGPNKKLILIKNKRNFGFAEGNNIAIRFACKAIDPDYILILNNDTVVDRHFLEGLVRVGESEDAIGIVGPKIYYYDFDGRTDVINFTGSDMVLWKIQEKRYGYNEIDEGQLEGIREIDRVEGSCMLIKKEVFQDIGLFDDTFFAYWEETDFCLRARKQGYKIIYSSRSKIWHKIASSTGGLTSHTFIYFFTRNRFIIAKKHIQGYNLAKFLIYLLMYKFWFDAGYFIKKKNRKGLMSFLKGTKEGLVYMLFQNVNLN